MTDPKQIAETVARLRAKDVPLLESGAFRETRACIREAADLLQSLAAENAALKAEAEAAAADRDDAEAWAKQHHADLLRAEAQRDRLAAELAEARAVLDGIAGYNDMPGTEWRAKHPAIAEKFEISRRARLGAGHALATYARAYLTKGTPT